MTRILTVLCVLTLAACSGDGATGDCVEGEYSCEGDVLQQCVDGALSDVEDCAAAGMMCMVTTDMQHCMSTTMSTEDTSMGTM